MVNLTDAQKAYLKGSEVELRRLITIKFVTRFWKYVPPDDPDMPKAYGTYEIILDWSDVVRLSDQELTYNDQTYSRGVLTFPQYRVHFPSLNERVLETERGTLTVDASIDALNSDLDTYLGYLDYKIGDDYNGDTIAKIERYIQVEYRIVGWSDSPFTVARRYYKVDNFVRSYGKITFNLVSYFVDLDSKDCLLYTSPSPRD